MGSLGISSRLQPWVTKSFRSMFENRTASAENLSRLHPKVAIDHWSAVSDGMHNLTTDLIHFQNHFYLVFSSSPWHIGSHKSRIRLLRSKEAKSWEEVQSWSVPKGDIRDPKLSVIHGKLILYVLKNEGWLAEPGTTASAVSQDGTTWSELTNVAPHHWLFWRPKSIDGKNWFLPAYWSKHGKSILLHSQDGLKWTERSVIHEGDHKDETDIEFLPDGRMMATARLEITGNLLGHAKCCTLVAIAEAPYTTWQSVRCYETRLDGPNLFRFRDNVYALGRRHDDKMRWPQNRGSILGKKRTALYRLSETGLSHITDLPSCGDTGYPGLVIQDDNLWVSYYTNDIARDYRWGVGMFLPSELRMAKLNLSQIQSL